MEIDENQLHEEMIINEENNFVVPDDLNGYTFNKNNSSNSRNLYIPPFNKIIMQGLSQLLRKAISFLDTKAFKITDDRAQLLRDIIQKDNTLTEEEKLIAIDITDPPYFFIAFTIRKAISLLDPKIYTTNNDRLRFYKILFKRMLF
ncbi:3747_t:CDS:2 [Funneliformis mosseae]|uniref:3747_t:CDS:1 n=1 Tax=Funneliformis mosseae TaxID=27381 RepID=A0A9N9FFI9_FUNMO|nr:3747_t:CDS:2 [Funneliformis mosseae]